MERFARSGSWPPDFSVAAASDIGAAVRWEEGCPGDYVWFPAGEATEHKLRNRYHEPCQFFLLGERKRDEVVVYPDTGQVHVRLLMQIFGNPVEKQETLTDE